MHVIFWNISPTKHYSAMSRYVGPYKLAHFLRKHDYEVQVIDFIHFMSVEELWEITCKFITPDTKVLGISTTFLVRDGYEWEDGSINYFPENIYKVSLRIKRNYPDIKIILGGHWAARHLKGVPDASIISYSSSVQDILLEYVNHQFKNTPLPLGKLLFRYSGEINKNLPPRMMYDTARNTTYNIEDDDFRWHSNDVILKGEPLPLDVSRGCIFACRFCQYPLLGKKKLDYIRGMDYIKTEILDNYERFNTTHYYILDDTFNDTTVKMEAFHKMVQTLPFKINFTAYLRADLLHRFPEVPYILYDSGLLAGYHGLESLHPVSSKILGKAWSGKHAREYIPKLFHDIWKGNVAQTMSFIMGIPPESVEDHYNTLKWFKDNRLHDIRQLALGITDKRNLSLGEYVLYSEFDRNHEKYGFKFISDTEWVNGDWTRTKAENLMAELDIVHRREKVNKMTAWYMSNLIWIGLDRQYLMETPRSDLDFDKITRLNKIKFREYFNRLSSL